MLLFAAILGYAATLPDVDDSEDTLLGLAVAFGFFATLCGIGAFCGWFVSWVRAT